MKSLLRSCFVARPEDDAEFLLRNFQSLRDADLGFESLEDNVIWTYIKDFVHQHHHVPDLATLKGHFTHIGEDEVADRMEVLSALPSKISGNFLTHLESKIQEHRTRQTSEILKEAATILQMGITIQDGKKGSKILKGPVHAIQYILDRGHDIVMPSSGVRLSGNVMEDTSNFKAEYQRVEEDPLAGIGQFTGVSQLDQSLRGAKRGELWTHAAFTGGLKSTLAIQWAYNQAIWYQHSSILFSLEMPYPQVRRLLVALHSKHDKFRSIRKSLGIGKSLDYQKIRDGELDRYSEDEIRRMPPAQRNALIDGNLNPSRAEKIFLNDYVLKDLEDPSNHYGNIHIEVADPDKTDFTVLDLRAKAELLYSKDPTIRTIFADHMGLMSPRRYHSSTTERLNEVVRDLKRLSMNFNRGLGIAVVGFFQISREGFKSAEKNDGRYNLTHLSYANEAERSSDIVTTTFVNDELRERSLVRFQCLKSRDNKPFDSFYAGVYWPCRAIYTTHDVTAEDARQAGDEIDMLAG